MEIGSDVAHMRQYIVAFQYFDILERRSAAHWVTRIGIPIGKQHVSTMGHTFHHAIGNDAGPQGQIARGQALGAGDDVGLDSEDNLGRKPMAQPPKACDNLVRDIQNIMGTTDIEAALVIALWRYNNAA